MEFDTFLVEDSEQDDEELSQDGESEQEEEELSHDDESEHEEDEEQEGEEEQEFEELECRLLLGFLACFFVQYLCTHFVPT